MKHHIRSKYNLKGNKLYLNYNPVIKNEEKKENKIGVSVKI